jgi:hypothetical protein
MATIHVDPEKPVVNDRQSDLIIVSFRLMRKIVGIIGLIIGILLPVITMLVSQCFVVQESISHYYYTIAGDVFVGLLCGVAFFLIVYPGNGNWEDLWTNIAGILALCVAFFPTGYQQFDNACTKFSYCYPDWVSTVHLVSAGLFFIILGGVAFFQFPKRPAKGESPEKRKTRNRFYRICGGVMWFCIALLIPMAFDRFDSYADFLAKHKIVFMLEVVLLLAFGLSWLIKGIALQGTPKNN